ncbi:putative ATP dependent RNA helicase [Fusarium bulbicola]|nr:putative ATP dependent RNA helicase [Fusarium bulbicola]
MDRYKDEIESCGRDIDKVRRALYAGFFRNAARKDPQEGYLVLVVSVPRSVITRNAGLSLRCEFCVPHAPYLVVFDCANSALRFSILSLPWTSPWPLQVKR